MYKSRRKEVNKIGGRKPREWLQNASDNVCLCRGIPLNIKITLYTMRSRCRNKLILATINSGTIISSIEHHLV